MARNMSTIARRRDLFAQGYNARSLQSALEEGHLKRLSRDLYSITSATEAITEKHSYVQVARLVPQGVFCLISALVFHEITTQVNHRMQIALPRPAFEPKITFLDVEYFHVSEAPYQHGVEEHRVEGMCIEGVLAGEDSGRPIQIPEPVWDGPGVGSSTGYLAATEIDCPRAAGRRKDLPCRENHGAVPGGDGLVKGSNTAHSIRQRLLNYQRVTLRAEPDGGMDIAATRKWILGYGDTGAGEGNVPGPESLDSQWNGI
jgi:hypothetical protein